MDSTSTIDYLSTKSVLICTALARAYRGCSGITNKIGWENALRGFLSRDWRNLASLDLHNPKTHHAMDKTNARLRKAMNSLYNYSRATWENRNELLHTTDSNALDTTI